MTNYQMMLRRRVIMAQQDAPFSWEIIGNTLYLRGSGAMPDYASVGALPWYDDRSSLLAVEISNRLTNIGNNSFRGCSSLTNINIPSNIKSIGENAFSHCYRMTSITIPGNIIDIKFEAFSSCNGLISIVMFNGIKNIGEKVFYNCYRIASVTIPSSVTSIGKSAFEYCSALKNVYYNGTQQQWNAITIGTGNSALINATIHYNWTPQTT